MTVRAHGLRFPCPLCGQTATRTLPAALTACLQCAFGAWGACARGGPVHQGDSCSETGPPHSGEARTRMRDAAAACLGEPGSSPEGVPGIAPRGAPQPCSIYGISAMGSRRPRTRRGWRATARSVLKRATDTGQGTSLGGATLTTERAKSNVAAAKHPQLYIHMSRLHENHQPTIKTGDASGVATCGSDASDCHCEVTIGTRNPEERRSFWALSHVHEADPPYPRRPCWQSCS